MVGSLGDAAGPAVVPCTGVGTAGSLAAQPDMISSPTPNAASEARCLRLVAQMATLARRELLKSEPSRIRRPR